MFKRKDLSLEEKLNLLKKYDEISHVSQREAASRLGIAQSTLNKLLKDRDSIESSALENHNRGKKRKRNGKDEEVEQALKTWFVSVRNKDARVDGPLLKKKAEDLAGLLGKSDFRATDGWFSRWLKRENIHYLKPHGEQGDAEHSAAEEWLATKWPSLISKYTLTNIYNADETGLYYRALPEHTYSFKHEKPIGVKIGKERITILCCASMSGEKRDLLVIGKAAKPRCFKNVNKLPAEYVANRNAWMTQIIFSDWLLKWDKTLKRDILLLVDNCTAHEHLPKLKHIEVVYLPANTTSIIQPCDQGIIRTFKAYYRSEMRARILSMIDSDNYKANEIAKKTSMLDALHLVVKAWNSVTSVTVENCFKKGGFTVPHDSNNNDDEFLLEEVLPLPSAMSRAEFIEWNSIDESLQTSTVPTEEDICCKEADNTGSINSYESDDECNDLILPTKKEMVQALDVLRRGVQFYGDNFNTHYNYENFIKSIINSKKKQTTIDDYFGKKK